VTSSPQAFRRVVLFVAVLNLTYAAVEFSVARRITAVSLFADSVDFLEDGAVNLLILIALGWSARHRATVGMLFAVILLIPGVAAGWAVWHQLSYNLAPDALRLSATGFGALVVNMFCAFLLAEHRATGGSLTRAAWLSARNDAYANLAIIAAGGITRIIPSRWPDLVVGVGILVLNLDAARVVFRAAVTERRLSPRA
jgi:Co/Zn/Cd efflux system component